MAWRFRFLRWYWMLLILVGIVSILVGWGYWYINRPEFYTFVQSKIKQELGIDVRWRSLEWSLRGWLKIVDAQVDSSFNQVPLHASADSMYVSQLISGKPDIDIRNVTISSGTAVIGSVSKTVLHWTRERQILQAQIALDRIFVDPYALPLERMQQSGITQPQPIESPSSLDLTWLDSVTISNTSIQVPSLAMNYLWDGAVRFNSEEKTVDLDLSAIPQSDDETSSLDIHALASLVSNQLQNLQMQANHFPVSVTGAVELSLVADGTMKAAMENEILQSDCRFFLRGMNAYLPGVGTGDLSSATVAAQLSFSPQWVPLQATASIEHSTYAFMDAENRSIQISSGSIASNVNPMTNGTLYAVSHYGIQEMNTLLPNVGAIELPNASVLAQMSFSPQWFPLQATATIGHSTCTFTNSTDRLIPIPAGTVSLYYDPILAKKIQADGCLTLVDHYSLVLGNFPFSATSSWSAGLTIEPRSIQGILSALSIHRLPMVDWVDGLISLQGIVEGQGTDLGNYRIKADLTDGQAVVENARITDGVLSAEISGQNTRGTVNVNGNANAVLVASGTHAIHLEHQFHSDGWFDWQQKSYELRISELDAGVVQSVSGWIRNGNRWRLEGRIPLEESIPKIRETLPVWGQALEGTGEMQVDMESAGTPMQAHITSPDFMLYSMSDDYTYGMQLRDFVIQGHYRENNRSKYRIEITAATPYITYGANDIEWPGQQLRLGLGADDANSESAWLRPPGGGEIAVVEKSQNEWNLDVQDLDIDSFLLPLAQRFVLDTNLDSPPVYSVDGNLSAQVVVRLKDDKPQMKGTAQLFLRSLSVPLASSFSLQNATIGLPVEFPLTYDRLTSKAITVSAQRISWEGTEYKNASFEIPFVSNTIQLTSHFVLPLFGGEVIGDNLRIENWLADNRSLEGSIRLNNLQLAKVNALLPIVPAEGVASGQIDKIVLSGERIELKGALTLQSFGGTVSVRDVFIRNSFGGAKVFGFSADIDRIDLQKLAAYFQYGSMNGILFGRMRNIQLIVPPPGSNDLITPDRLDIEIYSDPEKEGMISRDTLFKIVDLSGKTDMDLSKIKIDQFRFAQIGLRVLLNGIELRMMGTLDNNMFIAPSKNLFANKIGIRLSSSDKTLNFIDFWHKLLAQTGRTP